MVPLSPRVVLLLSLFLFTFTDLRASVTATTTATTNITSTTEYLKLPLLHITPFHSTPLQQVLSSDIRRLSFLHDHCRRSRSRRSSSPVTSPVISGASSGSGQYFVSLRLGSPPQKLHLVADTGSDLVWVKCSACKNCSNHPLGSAFLARHSTTFSPAHCYHPLCQLVPHPTPNPCNRTRLHSPCRYSYSYSDGSKTTGFFSRETATLNTSSGRVKRLRDLKFGCGFRISGPSVAGSSFNGAQGVVGLGRGPISFSSQLGRRFGSKFSYCLMDYSLSPPPTSYLMIGEHGVASNRNRSMSFTPLLSNPLSPTFYYITIKNAAVNGAKLPIDPSVWSIDELGNGGTVIDSGTTLSFLPDPAYREILAAFKRRLKLPSPAELPPGFDLCVNVSGVARPSLPRLSFELDGGSVFAPPARNYFIETSDRVKCLGIQPAGSGAGFSVIGNLMQQGFLLEFDRDRSRLGFSRRGCSVP